MQPKNAIFIPGLNICHLLKYVFHGGHFEVNLASESSDKSGQMRTSRTLDCYPIAPVHLQTNVLRFSNLFF